MSRTETVEMTDEELRCVRFEESCVLIPEVDITRSPGISMTTKAVPLPRMPSWTLKRSRRPSEEDEQDDSLVIKLPYPSFKRTNSHSRTRNPSASPPNVPLSPCLVHRDSDTPASPSPRTRPRRSSLPETDLYFNGSPLATIPLRKCCKACVTITEESVNDPNWEEKFSRGAQRKRRCSSESSAGLDEFKLQVDEVDKRRRSVSLEPPSDASDASPISPCLHSPTKKFPPARSSPIVELEEDEDQLFPLPSPRRTPSPATPPSASQSSNSSPNASTSNLLVTGANKGGRKSPLSSEVHLVDEEKSLLSGSISRKDKAPSDPSGADAEAQEIDAPPCLNPLHDTPKLSPVPPPNHTPKTPPRLYNATAPSIHTPSAKSPAHTPALVTSIPEDDTSAVCDDDTYSLPPSPSVNRPALRKRKSRPSFSSITHGVADVLRGVGNLGGATGM